MKNLLKVGIFMLLMAADFSIQAYTATCYCRNMNVKYVNNVTPGNYKKKCERACRNDQGLSEAELN